MTILTFLILTFATWRLSSLLSDEAGPWDVFSHLRHRAGVRIDDVGQPYGTNALARGVICLWCVSVWIGVGWVLLHYVAPTVAFWLALPLAFSAGAILVSEVLRRGAL